MSHCSRFVRSPACPDVELPRAAGLWRAEMSRPHLPIGTWGNVRSRAQRKDAEGKVVSWRASTYFRDHDGHTREVTASAKTKGAAEHRLLTKLRDRAKITQYGELSPTDKINDLIDL